MNQATFTGRELFLLTEALRAKIKADCIAERAGEINGIFIDEYAALRRKVSAMHEASFAE